MNGAHFNLPARVLHWSMAAMILAMLFIGVAMVASLSARQALLAVHRPLGMLILLLAGLRLLNPGSPTDRRRQPHCTYLTATLADAELRDVTLHRLPPRA